MLYLTSQLASIIYSSVHNKRTDQIKASNKKKNNRMSTIIKQSTKICPGPNNRIDTYLWKIENFISSCTESSEQLIESPIFGHNSLDELWRISFSVLSHPTNFILHHSTNEKEGPLPTSFEVEIIDKNFSKNVQSVGKNIYVCKMEDKSSCLYSVLNINLLNVVKLNPSNWLTDDLLTISIKVVRGHESLPTKINHQLISGLLSCLQNEKFSDIVLEVDGKELKAHKMILSLKSPVFSAKFDHKSMKESRDNRVVIKDIDVDVVKQLLEYIYTEKTPSNIDDCVQDLLGAANKYQIDDLKEICENNLMEKLTVDNAVDTLIVADRYDAKELKNKVAEFIKQNVSIFDSVEFKDLESKNANLAIEVFRKLIPEK